MAKPSVFEIEATITERGQTTVPAHIRKMLAVKKTATEGINTDRSNVVLLKKH